ncbi:DNA repair helicase XPB [Alicyclobacillus sp.]|uniref:DNA repair helicase XPB n=1 Tax=Alicyclobacillus sp. TaxID=61169 RepID=UPI0025B89646|nr:DNA repair helicase XPB [Alicyclobacillus sp.]MCL6515544.1 helicase-associated domain-containing protein [Alicyclobacillus sp.]
MRALLYVQNDGTLLVQSDHPRYEAVRPLLLGFAEMVQRMEPMHIYRIRPLSLWQAASLGLTAREILTFLRDHAAHPLPYALQRMIADEMAKWGRLTMHQGARGRIVVRGDADALDACRALPDLMAMAHEARVDGIVFNARDRARIKRTLAASGWPVADLVGYRAASTLSFDLRPDTRLRDYQVEAVRRFLQDDHDPSGVIVLPCGAGKTLVGIAILQALGLHALVLTPSETAARQWERELLSRTTLSRDAVALYGDDRRIAPITITTYQRVAARDKQGRRRHLETLTRHPWGIVVYDEVHVLPAPLFRLAADLQGARRLGLTATLVREDGAETDVFSLIGPKRYEVPWKQLEQAGYLASVRCVELHVPLPAAVAARYAAAGVREKHRIAAANPEKRRVVEALLQWHRGESALILGHYLDPLSEIAAAVGCPLITGSTPQAEREQWFEGFRCGRVRCLALSRVANMAVDLPSASVAIQVSGLFGSRQEEAQRLGRLLRPQTQEGVFYTLVSRGTVEAQTAKHRQLYLVEQGYSYEVYDSDEYLPKGMDDDEPVGMSEHR